MLLGLSSPALLAPLAIKPALAQEEPTIMESPGIADAQPVYADYEQPPSDTAIADDQDPSALTEFRPVLDPYGQWMDDSRYGHVWIPDRRYVTADFVPYVTAGHWALDSMGRWLWVSDYPWGHVAFHYGRWIWIPGRGWAWVPGRAYAPAWVTWSVTPDHSYVGWAPTPPRFCWFRGGAVDVSVPLVSAYFRYAPTQVVFRDHVARYIERDPARRGYLAARARVYEPQRARYAPVGPSWRQLGIPATVARGVVTRADPRSLAYVRRVPDARYRSAPEPAYRSAPRLSQIDRRPIRAPAPRQAPELRRPPERPETRIAPAVGAAPRPAVRLEPRPAYREAPNRQSPRGYEPPRVTPRSSNAGSNAGSNARSADRHDARRETRTPRR